MYIFICIFPWDIAHILTPTMATHFAPKSGHMQGKVQINIFIYIYTHIQLYTHIYIHIFVATEPYVHTWIYLSIYTCPLGCSTQFDTQLGHIFCTHSGPHARGSAHLLRFCPGSLTSLPWVSYVSALGLLRLGPGSLTALGLLRLGPGSLTPRPWVSYASARGLLHLGPESLTPLPWAPMPLPWLRVLT